MPEDVLQVVNSASFDNCTFTNNSSPTGGSAISLVSNLGVNQVVTTTNFINWCVARSNYVMNLISYV